MAYDRVLAGDCGCCVGIKPLEVEVVLPPVTVQGVLTQHCPCVTGANGPLSPLFATVAAVSGIPCLVPFSLPLAAVGCTDLGQQTWTASTLCRPNFSGCNPSGLFGGVEEWAVQYAACSPTVTGPPNACGNTSYATDHNFRIGWSVCNNLLQTFETVVDGFTTAEFYPGVVPPASAPVTGAVALRSFQCSPPVIVYRVTLPADNPFYPNGVFDVTITA